MPSERFWKLPEEKKEKIRAAAMREYCSEPMENVSINRIIKEAGISRGSFYTYFEDKQDVLQYLIEDNRRMQGDFMRRCMLETGGDYMKTVDRFLENCLSFFSENRVFDFSRNIALRNGFDPAAFMSGKRNRERDSYQRELAAWMFEHLDHTKYAVPDAETMNVLMLQCDINVMMTVSRILICGETREAALSMYRNMMKILMEGVCRR